MKRGRWSRQRTPTAARSLSTPTVPTASSSPFAPARTSIEHGTVMDDEILRLFKQTGAYYVPTLSTVNGYLERLANPNA